MLERNSLYGERLTAYVRPNPGENVNIDTPEDWEKAERLLSGMV